MNGAVTPVVLVGQDYEGYFEALVKHWVERKVQSGVPFKNRKIYVTAGPYRPAAVAYEVVGDTLKLDFYAALRRGFGALSEQDVVELIELL